MSDREALAAALAKPWPVHWEKNSIITAARERLAQLPEKCGTGSCGHYGIAPPYDKPNPACPTCHGSGKVYPAELVERIARAYMDYNYGADVAVTDADRGFAVAVLDALNGETPGERAGRLHRQFKDQPGDLP